MKNDLSLLKISFFSLLCISLSACVDLNVDNSRKYSHAFSYGQQTTLAKQLKAAIDTQPDNYSGFMVLDTGKAALLKRLAIVAAAEKAIDLQYYIWNSDHSGRLLAEQLVMAADRGVHVRLLLDDFNSGERDQVIGLLSVHPNIEVRLYNPNSVRKGIGQYIDLVSDFDRINQRMHNKSIVVDGTVAIVGGRNIGDEYFDLHQHMNFLDRDLVVVGSVIADVSTSFDAYWNNDRAFTPSDLGYSLDSKQEVTDFRSQFNNRVADDRQYIKQAYNESSLFEETLNDWLTRFTWAEAELVFDHPKSIDDNDGDQIKHVARKLAELSKQVESELIIESAYLVPGDSAIELLGELVKKGVTVNALTNSLASNDLTTNHAGYARRRKQLLENSVQLYELRPDAVACQTIVDSSNKCGEETLFGLHAKSIVFDRKKVFIGSFNVNQRSIYLNSETAMIIHSTELAEQLAKDIKSNFAGENSWHVQLNADDDLEWIGKVEGEEQHYLHDPQTDFWRRFSSGFFSLLPIEKYL